MIKDNLSVMTVFITNTTSVFDVSLMPSLSALAQLNEPKADSSSKNLKPLENAEIFVLKIQIQKIFRIILLRGTKLWFLFKKNKL